MHTTTIVAASIASASLVSAALAGGHTHAGDITLRVLDGAITTGVMHHGEFEIDRVFGADLGEVVPNTADEPGFDSAPGTFAAGSSIGFRIMNGLRSWDGTDFDSLAGPDMTISFLTLSTDTPSSLGSSVEGFSLPVTANGQWHRHFTYTLNNPATTGVYLLELQLFSSDAALDASDPFYLVFNQNESEGVHDAAMDYVREHIVPAPGVLTPLAMVGGLAGLRRRRRSALGC